MLANLCKQKGARFAPAQIFAKGGEGGIELANAVLEAFNTNEEKKPKYTYELDWSVEKKIEAVATKIYGAKEIDILPEAKAKMEAFVAAGYGKLPICIAKTQYSLSDNQKALGRPTDFTLTVRDVWLSAAAGYLVVLTGAIVTMPGLPKHPAAMDINIEEDGTIEGLF